MLFNHSDAKPAHTIKTLTVNCLNKVRYYDVCLAKNAMQELLQNQGRKLINAELDPPMWGWIKVNVNASKRHTIIYLYWIYYEG